MLRTLWLDDLPDLILGSRCVGCDRPGRALCGGCGAELGGKAYVTVPDPVPAGLPQVFAMTAYAGVAREALLAHKERGRVTLAGPLGQALAHAVEAALTGEPAGLAGSGGARVVGSGGARVVGSGGARVVGSGGAGLAGSGDAAQAGRSALPLSGSVGAPPPRRIGSAADVLLVPVPSARRAVRARGYDPLLAIARHAVRRLRRSGHSVRLIRPVRLNRRVADQAELGAAERMANLAGAFTVHPRWRAKLAGRSIVLLDDLITTGATLRSVAEALRAAGAHVPAAAVVAATARHPNR